MLRTESVVAATAVTDGQLIFTPVTFCDVFLILSIIP